MKWRAPSSVNFLNENALITFKRRDSHKQKHAIKNRHRNDSEQARHEHGNADESENENARQTIFADTQKLRLFT